MNFVILHLYTDYIEANIILGRLQSEGINCWLQDETTATVAPFLLTYAGGIKLMVAESQAERASELLKLFKNNSPEE